MPMTHSSTPFCPPCWIEIVEERDQASPPSSEKRFWPTYLVCRYRSRPSAADSCQRIFFCSSAESAALEPAQQVLVLQPQALFGVRDVRELGADGAAVHVLELRDDFAQLQALCQFTRARAGQEFGIEIGFAEPEVAELQHARPRPLLHAERIEVGDQVTAVGVDLHQARNRALLGRRLRARLRGHRGHARPGRPLDDSRLYRGVNLFTRAAVFELQEVFAPLSIDALRIGQKLLIESFDIGSVTARERRRGQQLAKAWRHTGKKSLWTQGPGATKGRYVSRSCPHRKGNQ